MELVSQMPNKINYFIWLCQHGWLPTRKYPHSKGINIDKLCHICNKTETIDHIFIKFYVVKNVERPICPTTHKSI